MKQRDAGAIVRTSDDLPRGHWMKRQLPKGTSLRPYAEDAAMSALIGAAIQAVDDAGLTRKQVAGALGCTRSHVSQLLRGKNMTLNTLASLFWACGLTIEAVTVRETGGEALGSEHSPTCSARIDRESGDDRRASGCSCGRTWTLPTLPAPPSGEVPSSVTSINNND